MTHKICDSCETVSHCRAFGCVPLQPAQRQETCPTCGQYEPRTGTCGTSPNDERALCNRNAPQPAQRKPLMDDEIELLAKTLEARGDTLRQFARAIEAAHGIKS